MTVPSATHSQAHIQTYRHSEHLSFTSSPHGPFPGILRQLTLLFPLPSSISSFHSHASSHCSFHPPTSDACSAIPCLPLTRVPLLSHPRGSQMSLSREVSKFMITLLLHSFPFLKSFSLSVTLPSYHRPHFLVSFSGSSSATRLKLLLSQRPPAVPIITFKLF